MEHKPTEKATQKMNRAAGNQPSDHIKADGKMVEPEYNALQKVADKSSAVAQLNAYQQMADEFIPNGLSQGILQKMDEPEEEEILQGKFKTVQKKAAAPAIITGNDTGLPAHLKSGIENLSGNTMDDVKVHYNSDKPAQFQAHAYAQGTDIHLGSGQEKHLPHEAWHVVQQKQGRVKPTRQMKGKVNINDDAGLEKEADRMGEKAGNLGTAKFEATDKGAAGAKGSVLHFQKDKTVQRVSTGIVQFYPPQGFLVHSHFEDQMGNRRISEATVDDVVNNGTVYDDSGMPGATVYYKNGTAVIHDGKQLKTCYRGKVKNRWDER